MNIQRTPWRQGADGALAFMRAGSRKAVMLLMGLLALLGAPAHAEKHIYYVTDAQGTVVATMDSQARVTYTAAYRPYGEQAEGAPQAGPGYTGHVNDPATGLVYMQQRYYDPEVGRFLSPDPVVPVPGDVFNFGRYTYANNNPARYTDPDGRQSVGEWIDKRAMQAAGSGNTAATYGWAFAGTAWKYLGAEGVSQIADKGWSNVGTGDRASAVLEATAVLPPVRIVGEIAPIAKEVLPTIKAGSAGGETAGKAFSNSVKAAARTENPGAVCVYCRMPGTASQVDHAIPRARGGNATLDNAQLACPHCNTSKGARDVPVTPPPGYRGEWPPPHWNQQL